MISRIKRSPLLAVALVALLGLGAWLALRPARSAAGGTTFAARQGPLDITVLSGGTVEALEKQEIRSEVRGEPVKILRIVDEGYLVTEEDVRAKKVLAELDASKLRQQVVNQDITFQSTVSGLTEAQQAYEIQINQNKVDVKTAEQEAKFAFMDMEKFLGDRITRELVERLDLREHLQTNAPATNPPPATAATPAPGAPATGPAPAPTLATNSTPAPDPEPAARAIASVDFTQYAKAELLGDGAAKQEVRKREDEVFTARTALGQAQAKLAGTKRLFEKGFVTKTELESDQTAADQARLKLESAETARDLYTKYEFVKAAEEFTSKYDKALRSLERSRKEAVSKLAQAQAKLKGAQGRYQIERDNLQEVQDMIGKCVLTATKAGLVAYGGGGDENWYGRDPIRVGSQVFERQTIITIPDTTKMGVRMQVHESHIKKIKKGLSAKIIADAQPEDKLEGEVSKVGVLPDSRNRWMNPDMNVYQCSVDIRGAREWLKPGMSTKVEILVKQIPSCIYVPLQAVTTHDGKQFVYFPGASPKEHEIEVGDFNDEFIEVKKGLAAGEVVLLRKPDSERQGADQAKPDAAAKAPAAAATTTAAPAAAGK